MSAKTRSKHSYFQELRRRMATVKYLLPSLLTDLIVAKQPFEHLLKSDIISILESVKLCWVGWHQADTKR